MCSQGWAAPRLSHSSTGRTTAAMGRPSVRHLLRLSRLPISFFRSSFSSPWVSASLLSSFYPFFSRYDSVHSHRLPLLRSRLSLCSFSSSTYITMHLYPFPSDLSPAASEGRLASPRSSPTHFGPLRLSSPPPSIPPLPFSTLPFTTSSHDGPLS